MVSKITFEEGLDLDIASPEIDAILSPFVSAQCAKSDPAWQADATVQATRLRKKKWKRWTIGNVLPFLRRSQKSVEDNYSKQWVLFDWQKSLEPGQSPSRYEWRDKGFLDSSACMRHVYQLFLMRTLDHLKPQTVFEVGFGSGHNLLMLAARFPEIQFHGIELTEGGTQTAQKVAREGGLPDFFQPIHQNR
jgi:tRNA G46 methylase TrmB